MTLEYARAFSWGLLVCFCLTVEVMYAVNIKLIVKVHASNIDRSVFYGNLLLWNSSLYARNTAGEEMRQARETALRIS